MPQPESGCEHTTSPTHQYIPSPLREGVTAAELAAAKSEPLSFFIDESVEPAATLTPTPSATPTTEPVKKKQTPKKPKSPAAKKLFKGADHADEEPRALILASTMEDGSQPMFSDIIGAKAAHAITAALDAALHSNKITSSVTVEHLNNETSGAATRSESAEACIEDPDQYLLLWSSGEKLSRLVIHVCSKYYAHLTYDGSNRFVVYHSPNELTTVQLRIRLGKDARVLHGGDLGVVIVDSKFIYIYTFDPATGLTLFKRVLDDERRAFDSALFASIQESGKTKTRLYIWNSTSPHPVIDVLTFDGTEEPQVLVRSLSPDVTNNQPFFLKKVVPFALQARFIGVDKEGMAVMQTSENGEFKESCFARLNEGSRVKEVFQDRHCISTVAILYEDNLAFFLQFGDGWLNTNVRSIANVDIILDQSRGLWILRQKDGRVYMFVPFETEARRNGNGDHVMFKQRNIDYARFVNKRFHDVLENQDLMQFLSGEISHSVCSSDIHQVTNDLRSAMAGQQRVLDMFRKKCHAMKAELDEVNAQVAKLVFEVQSAESISRICSEELASVKAKNDQLLLDANVMQNQVHRKQITELSVLVALRDGEISSMDNKMTEMEQRAAVTEASLLQGEQMRKDLELRMKEQRKEHEKALKRAKADVNAAVQSVESKNREYLSRIEDQVCMLEGLTLELNQLKEKNRGLEKGNMNLRESLSNVQSTLDHCERKLAAAGDTHQQELRTVREVYDKHCAKLEKTIDDLRREAAKNTATALEKALAEKTLEFEEHCKQLAAKHDTTCTQLVAQHTAQRNAATTHLQARIAELEAKIAAISSLVAAPAPAVTAPVTDGLVAHYTAELAALRDDIATYRCDVASYRADIAARKVREETLIIERNRHIAHCKFLAQVNAACATAGMWETLIRRINNLVRARGRMNVDDVDIKKKMADEFDSELRALAACFGSDCQIEF